MCRVSSKIARICMLTPTESIRRIFASMLLAVQDIATRCVFARCTNREVSCRCCLASFLVAWVRKMSANHCLGLVMLSPPANSCRMLVQHQFHAACWNLSFAIFSLIAVLCFVISHCRDLLLYASYNVCFSGQQKNTVTRHRFFHVQIECRRLP